MRMTTLETRKARPRYHHRRGAIVVLVAVMMGIFILAAAFSVDVGYMQLTRSQLRIATDAAARAGGEALAREQNPAAAVRAAKAVAAQNMVAQQPLLLEDSDITLGSSQRQPNGTWLFIPGGTPTNSLQVTGRRTRDAPSGSIPLFLGRFAGVADFQPIQDATVVRLDRDICIVVDRSTSMKRDVDSTVHYMHVSDPAFCLPPSPTSRWIALEAALLEFTRILGTTRQPEHVGLVSYASNFNGHCDHNNLASEINQFLTPNLSSVDQAVQAITASPFNGNTQIADGILKGIDVLTDSATSRPLAVKTMIVMTDGRNTSGNPVAAARQAANQDIIVHSITFASGADQQQMIDVSSAGGGNHYHAPDAVALEQIFREIALSMLVTLTE